MSDGTHRAGNSGDCVVRTDLDRRRRRCARRRWRHNTTVVVGMRGCEGVFFLPRQVTIKGYIDN